jgi:hypothetical protein
MSYNRGSDDWSWAFGAGVLVGVISFGLILLLLTDWHITFPRSSLETLEQEHVQTIISGLSLVAATSAAFAVFRQLSRLRLDALDRAEQHREQLLETIDANAAERFAKALEMLESESISSQRSGIYSLEAIAERSPEDWALACFEVLSDFVNKLAAANLDNFGDSKFETLAIGRLSRVALKAKTTWQLEAVGQNKLTLNAVELDSVRISGINANEIIISRCKVPFNFQMLNARKIGIHSCSFQDASGLEFWQNKNAPKPWIFIYNCDLSGISVYALGCKLIVHSCHLDSSQIYCSDVEFHQCTYHQHKPRWYTSDQAALMLESAALIDAGHFVKKGTKEISLEVGRDIRPEKYPIEPEYFKFPDENLDPGWYQTPPQKWYKIYN